MKVGIKMKKVILTTALLGLFSTSLLGGVTAFAADPAPLPTDGEIKFTTDEDEEGEVIKPNPDEEDEEDQEVITPEDGGSTRGPLRIQFVPDFKFGVKKGISSGKMVEDVLVIPYKDQGNQPTGKAMPTFVQVTDNRGLSTADFTDWTLSVYASEFKAADHELTGSHVKLNESTLTTTLGDTDVAGNLVNGNALGEVIPTTAAKPLTVLASKGVNTNGHQVSNVFHANYKKETTYAPETRSHGAEFVKPAGIAPQKDVLYTATMTWTLTSGL